MANDKLSKGLSEERSTIGEVKSIFSIEFGYTLLSFSLSKEEIVILMTPINNRITTITESTTPTIVDKTFLRKFLIF